MELQPAAHDDASRGQIEGRPGGPATRVMLAHRPVGMQEVDGLAVLDERPLRSARLGGQRSADGGGNARKELEAAQTHGRCLSDECGERHPGSHDDLVTGELGTAEDALQFHHNGGQATVGDEQIVTAAEHDERQVLLLGKGEGVAEIIEILRHDEKLRGATHPQRGVEAEGLSEPDGAGDSS